MRTNCTSKTESLLALYASLSFLLLADFPLCVQFLGAYPSYFNMSFTERMSSVDLFIKDTVCWWSFLPDLSIFVFLFYVIHLQW